MRRRALSVPEPVRHDALGLNDFVLERNAQVNTARSRPGPARVRHHHNLVRSVFEYATLFAPRRFLFRGRIGIRPRQRTRLRRPGRGPLKGAPMRPNLRAMLVVSTVVAIVPSVHTPSARSDDGERRFDLASLRNDVDKGNTDGARASLSADGRFVAFASIADNLVPNDNNFSSDVFVRDRKTDTIERVSVGPAGVEGDANSGFLDLLGTPGI